MILYFSATGNSRFVATSLAKALEDETVDLAKRMHQNDTSPLESRKPFVLCAPVHVDGIPMAVWRHLKDTILHGSLAYTVVTMGSFAGVAGRQAEELFTSKQMEFKGWIGIAMPKNYIAGPFPEEDLSKLQEKILAAPAKIVQVAETIKRGEPLEGHHIPTVEYRLVLSFMQVWNKIGHPTRKFKANDRCISCGMCERICPVSTIRMTDGKPVWIDRQCMHCMACIQNCPKSAIEYGTALQRKRRYRFALYKDLLKRDE